MDEATLSATLRSAHVEFELIDVGASTRTAAEAALALGVPIRSVIKSLLCFADTTPVLALVPGDRTLAIDRLRCATGATDVTLAPGKAVKAVTGYPVGAVAPLGHPAPLPTYCDTSLRDLDEAYFGGGSPSHMLRMAIADFESIARPTWTRLTEAGPSSDPGSPGVPA